MKKLIFILMVCFGITSCIPTGGGNPTGRIKAQLIRTTCASIVIQIQDPNYYSLGEQWSDIFRPSFAPYEHVVSVSNTCEFPSSINEGDVFYFQIDTNNSNNCVVCAMYDAPPTKKVAVKNITR